VRLGVSLLAFRPGRIGGTETYLRELLGHLSAAAGGDELFAVLGPEADAALPEGGWRRVVVPWSDAALVAARMGEAFTPWRARALERVFARESADALLFPQQSIFPKRVAGPAVLTVHDVQHLAHPENLGAFDRAFRAGIYGASLRRADRVIAISRFTSSELQKRCGVPAARVEVVPHGARPPPSADIAPWTGAGGPYLYYPAATWPHKDHATLLRSYAALRRAGRIAERLVLTGERTGHWRSLARSARVLGIAADVRHLGFLPGGEMERVFAGARALVFPSRHEGFGLPVLEAARLGVPMITSRLPIFEELGVPARRRIDFADPEALWRALTDGGGAALERTPATWAEVAARTVDVLRAAAASGTGA
jgi:glycosyltransferase involved in cell wall biosynthesis